MKPRPPEAPRAQAPPPLTAVAAAIMLLVIPGPSASAAPVEKLQDFDLGQVRVTDPSYQNLFDKEVEYMMKLDPDRLVAAFKAVSEGKDPGTTAGLGLYGGWEGGWSLLRGHTLGHYLSAMAHAYEQTRGTNQALCDQIAQRIDFTVGRLKTFQDQSASGYLFGSPESHFDVIEGRAAGSSWAPWYTMHKVISGLIDVHVHQGNTTALQVASRLGDWAYERSSKWNATVRTRVLAVEYGGMNDCLYELYKLTGEPRHLAAAHAFDEDALFTPVSQGRDVLEGLHANTQFPKFIGALNRYRTLGTTETFYYTAAQRLWSMVLKDHTYVTGGNSQLEHFGKPQQLDAKRDNTNNETCNSYNMLKLTRELFKLTGDVAYADYYERAHINEILAAVNPTNGMTMYFKPMGTGYFKAFGTEETFWCCNGTGMENYVKLGDSLYFHDATDLYVNLYVSSTLRWDSRGLSLSLAADLPRTERVTLTITQAPTDAVKLKLRKPSWTPSCRSPSVSVNGERFDAPEVAGYLEVRRAWRPGDRVEVTFPMEVQVSRLPDNPAAVAFTYGPVVLSAGLGTERMVTEPQWASAKATIPPGVVIKDTIRVNGTTTVNDWLRDIGRNLVRTPGTLEFTLRDTDEDGRLKFTPHYQRYADRYGIYFRLEGRPGGTVADAGACVPEPSPRDDGGAAADAGADRRDGGTWQPDAGPKADAVTGGLSCQASERVGGLWGLLPVALIALARRRVTRPPWPRGRA